MSEENKTQQVTGRDKKNVDENRRNALKKMGGYTAYTAPALLAMLAPKEGRAGGMSMLPPPLSPPP